jgi:hypothetical protein
MGTCCGSPGFWSCQRSCAQLGYKDTPIIPGQQWHVHDPDRPHPRMVTPGALAGADQDHGHPVRYRNIWVRRLAGYDQPEK